MTNNNNSTNKSLNFASLSFADAPSIKVSPPGPISQEYLNYQFSNEGSAISYPRSMPMAIKRAKGATVEDVDGNHFIDFFGGAGVLNVGHSNPDVISAAKQQLNDLTHALDISNPSRRSLVELLLGQLPKELNRVFFGAPTGSDAVECAIKLAKYNSKRYPVIAFEGSYHGMTAGALSLCSGRTFKEEFLPLIAETHFVPYAYCYRCAFDKSPDTCNSYCAQYLEHKLDDPHSGIAQPAAIIVEAIQGEGGSIVPPDHFLLKLREICTAHNIIFIVDEIQAGFCRTGKMFSFQHTDTIPDIITMSKALGGVGFPISCVAFKEEFNTLPPGAHIGTFRGNVIAFAAGKAAIDFMISNELADHSDRMGKSMLNLLKEIQKDSKIIGDVRGKGLMLGVEFVKDRSSKEPAPEFAAEVRNACFKMGMLIEIGGHYFNVARFLPPLIITEELIQKGAQIFSEAVKKIESSM